VSDATERKIVQKHGIQMDELADAVVNKPGLRVTWNEDGQRGRRLIVEAYIKRRKLYVVLYPTDVADEWNLGSAYYA
jgi:uncharacterized DUF497 family protein